MSSFVHLHCHTEYSLLDGAIRLKDLCNRAHEWGMPAAAITDHGNLYGATHFYAQCKSVGIKPIIGCEVYVCHDHTDRESDRARKRHHLVLLAQNTLGYHNLVRLVTEGWLYGLYYKPRVDKEILRKYSEGIIALSACLAGEIPRAIVAGNMDGARDLIQEYADIYPDRFYLEIQENGLPEQTIVNNGLLELAESTHIPLVATNDCHYLEATDVHAHDVLLCIQTTTHIHDPKRMRFDTRDLYYKSAEQMYKEFSHVPQALENTLRIADMCNVEMTFGKHFFPVYEVPEGMTPATEFRRLSEEGLAKRLAQHPDRETLDHEAYKARLELEINVILDMGFPDYFLIVQDFINWAKEHGIPVGPGRGSAAGSLVAWALRITNLDPIPYNLLFERFLNSERVSLPDIDVDFCERRRVEVIRYMVEKYGETSVAQITTFGKMKAKAVVRDVGRALGISYAETDRVAKLIPEDLKMTVQKAINSEAELEKLYLNDTQIKNLLDTSLRLEGLSRHASTHAAGLVVSDKAMSEYLPLYKGKKGELVTQFDMKMVEKVGLVKFDFLGLRTMTLIQDSLDAIAHQGKEVPDLDTLPFTDTATYELYSRGETDGIFQVESSGMRQYLRQLKPSCFEDIIAMLALYRPGPLGSGMVDEFIKRKHGEVPVTYPLYMLEECLKDTYGVIVYQEQVMQIAQIVAKYTLGGADLLRRAMGKKNPEAMAKERSTFVEGASKNGIPEKKSNEIFDLMEKFAEYGFNKSHSAAYALISYHTAYLKVHYKVEFMAALLTSEMGTQEKLLKYVAACKDMDIEVLPPSVNISLRAFSAHKDDVIFGLGGIKNVGDEAIGEIVRGRTPDEPYASLFDMACRVNLRKVTKRVLEFLIKSGACDCFGVSRAAMLASLDTVVAQAQSKAKAKASNQMSLFAMIPAAAQPAKLPGVGLECPEAHLPEMDDSEKLRKEKEALGFFLSSHPLTAYGKEIIRLRLTRLEDARAMTGNAEISCAVLVTGIKEVLTKSKGERMAFVTVEDVTGHGEVTFFSEPYARCRELLHSEEPILLEARLDGRNAPVQSYDDEEGEDEAPQELKMLGNKVMALSEGCAQNSSPICVYIPPTHLREDRILALQAILEKHRGRVEAQAQVTLDGYHCFLTLGPQCSVQPGPELTRDLANWSAVESV